MASIHKIRNCTISSLKPNQEYLIYATSSTIIGRSNFSSSILAKTLESPPLCEPILTATEVQTDAVLLVWEPSLNESQVDPYWLSCIGGALRNFTLYTTSQNKSANLTYTGLDNQFTVTDLNVSSLYVFKVVMCNQAGCISSGPLEVRTLDPPPNSWTTSTKPKFVVLFILEFIYYG